MTRFDSSTFGQDMGGGQKTSGLAISSLVCSLICCLPVTTILGVVLGIAAMVSISSHPEKKGKGLAIAGILLGVVFTIGHAVVYPKAWAMMKEWYAVIETGPRDALAAGFTGDIAGFKAAFHGAGATASDAEAKAFIDELRSRYGEFNGSRRLQQQTGQTFGSPVVPFAYAVEFSQEEVNAETEIVFSDPKTGGFIMKIGHITIFDEERGDLTYPPREGS